MTTTTGSGHRSRTLQLALLALALLVVGLTWWQTGQDDPAPATGQTASPPPPPTATADPSPAASPAPRADDGATPSGRSEPSSAPSPGSLEPAPYAEVTPEPAVPLTATADFGTGLRLRITEVESVRSAARRPGEISAPAVRVTMRAENSSSKPISVEDMVVVLDHGPERIPAINVVEPGGQPFAGVVAPGTAMRGVYVFNVSPAERADVRLTASYSGSAPTLVLAGSVS